MRRPALVVAAFGLVSVSAWLLLRGGPRLPEGVAGTLVFVGDRDGVPVLFVRRLPKGGTRRLVFGSEGVGEPALSPDGTRIAFSMNGRIGVGPVAGGPPTVLTLGVDWHDAQPAWLPDGRRLVVSARRRAGEPAGLQLLEPAADGTIARRVLTRPRASDDTNPVSAPDGAFVIFVREHHLMRVGLADGRVRLLTGGFKRERSPRFLPSGRLVCAWSEGKRNGIDTLDSDGRSRRTLVEGGRFYRTLAPSPDGRFLVATLGYDLGFRPLAVLLGAPHERLCLLDSAGRDLGHDLGLRGHASYAADWSR
jgi:Tol biopolymer transport system component